MAANHIPHSSHKKWLLGMHFQAYTIDLAGLVMVNWLLLLITRRNFRVN